MSKYLPLHLKYRPTTFADMIGQSHIVNALSNAIKLDRIANAYLFCGPRGTGKTSSARILAKSLNCKNGPTITPCDKCASCLDIINGNPIDVIEIDAASNRLVEDAQNILDKIQYVPVNGRFRIYIIDEVHMLSNHAFNALLKTLEEPPNNVVFILATTEPQKVLETIISRCQRYDFRRITINDIVNRLEYICNIENIDIEKDALFAIARNCCGGMRDALSLLDQLSILNIKGIITAKQVDELLGKISIESLCDIAKCISTQNPTKVIEIVNSIFTKGNEPVQIMTNLMHFFRNLSIIKTCKNSDTIKTLTNLNEQTIEVMKVLSNDFSVNNIIFLIEKIASYLREIKNSNEAYLWLEVCLMELCSEKFEDICELLNEVRIIKKQINNVSSGIEFSNIQSMSSKKDIESEKNVSSLTSSKKTNDLVETEDKLKVISEKKEVEDVCNCVKKEGNWQNLLNHIDSMPSRAFYSSLAKPIVLTSDKIIISFGKDIFVKQAKDPNKSEAFVKAARKYFGCNDISIEVKLKSDVIKSNVFKDKNERIESEPKLNVESINKNITQKDNDEFECNEEDCKVNEEYVQSEEDVKASKSYNNIDTNEQGKMIIELFDGKVIEKDTK